MKKIFYNISILTLAVCLFSIQVIAQCKQEPNPDTWLYRHGFEKRIKAPGPEHFEYATKIKFLFGRGIKSSGSYSFVKSGNQRFLNLGFIIEPMLPFEMSKSNYLTIYLSNQLSVKLYPNYENQSFKRFNLKYEQSSICFFKLAKEDVEKIASATIDSLETNITILPYSKENSVMMGNLEVDLYALQDHFNRYTEVWEIEDFFTVDGLEIGPWTGWSNEITASFFFKNIAEGQRETFMEYARCYLQEY